MDIPSTSDYIEMKKRKAITLDSMKKTSSNYTTQKQYLVLQNTDTYTNDLRLETKDRYQILFPYSDYHTKKVNERKN